MQNQFTPEVSFFTSTFEPSFTVPSAPAGKNRIHYPVKTAELFKILLCIKKGAWRERMEALQKWPKHYNKAKKMLPCFTPHGVFQQRHDAHLIKFSGLVCLDYDKIPDLGKAAQTAARSKHTYAVFRSPSGNGLKVLARIASTDFKRAFQQVAEFYDQLLSLNHDASGKNISRLCYVSYDPELYLNENAIPLAVKSVLPAELPAYYSDFTEKVVKFTESKPHHGTYAGGNRNNFLFYVACNCNRFGISQSETEQICREIWAANTDNLPEAELLRTIKSAYSNAEEHGRFQNYLSKL